MSEQKLIEQVEKLLDISIALSNGEKTEAILKKILLCAKAVCNADGGTLYEIADDAIFISLIQSDSLHIHLDASTDSQLNFASIPLYHEDGSYNLSNVVSYAYYKQAAVNIPDVYDCNESFDFSGPKKFDAHNQYHTKSLLTIPLKNHKNTVIGVLQLINAIDPETQTVMAFDALSEKIATAIASQAAIVLTQQQLINDLEKLFESMVKVIPIAIDKKSPYTAAHARRVPIIAMMLAEAVAEIDHGCFKDFTLSKADRYELEVATWLHDCGKIATPEYVMDKSTKLQTIYDRIHLIQTRFEVLKRDQEITLLKNKLNALENGQNWDAADEQPFYAAIGQFADDLAFIQHINKGYEILSRAERERINDINRYQWEFAQQTLPFFSDDEYQNLSIVYGTVTPTELEIINKHINATMDMLNAIEFPEHLKHVREYAGCHHERMDGKGFPRGLTREQMSVQARIIAIADLFEALLSTDRPYRKGNKLSEALQILKQLRDKQHIDPDLYDVFMANKIYKKFADEFVDPELIDVD